MSKEIVKKETTAVSTNVQAPRQEIINSDILVPRLYLMQGLSDLVTARKAQQGDMVRSTTSEPIGGPDAPIDIIPLKYTTDWVLQEKVGSRFEYRRTESRTAANDSLPWDFMVDGKEWRRMKVLNLYALSVDDILNFKKNMEEAAKTGDIPDINSTVMPIVISFRSTSFNAGKTIATHFAKVEDAKRFAPTVMAYNYALPLGCSQEKNELGTYYVYTVGNAKKLDPALVEEAKRWYDILQNSSVRIDSEEDTPAPAASQQHF